MKTRKGSEPYIIEEIVVWIHDNGVTFDRLVVRNVPVTVDYTYKPGSAHDDEAKSLTADCIKTDSLNWATGTIGLELLWPVGLDILKLLNDHEVTAIEEEMMKRLENNNG